MMMVILGILIQNFKRTYYSFSNSSCSNNSNNKINSINNRKLNNNKL